MCETSGVRREAVRSQEIIFRKSKKLRLPGESREPEVTNEANWKRYGFQE
jgi:hypothetical protein